VTAGVLGFANSNRLPLMAGLPQVSANYVWRSNDGQTLEEYTPSGLSSWAAFYQEAAAQCTTRVGNQVFFITSFSGGLRTYRTSDFRTFSLNQTAISGIDSSGDIVLWHDRIGGRLCIAGIDSTSGNTLRIYTSLNLGASWTFQTAIATGASTRFWGAAEGTNHVGLSYDSVSGHTVLFINKNTFSNVRTSGSTFATSGAFRFIKGLGSGGAVYGRFIASDTDSLAYWDESESAVTVKSNSTKPSTSGAYFFIDVSSFGGTYFHMFKDNASNDTIKIVSASALDASPSWTEIYSRTGSLPTTQWQHYSNMVSHRQGITAFVTEGGTAAYAKLLFSSDGVTFSEISDPTGLSIHNFMGYVP